MNLYSFNKVSLCTGYDNKNPNLHTLKNDKLNEQYGRDGVQLCKKFTPDKIIKEWNRLFLKVLNDEKMEYIEPDSFMETNLKKYRCLNRKIKNAIGVEYPISVIGAESFARNVFCLKD